MVIFDTCVSRQFLATKNRSFSLSSLILNIIWDTAKICRFDLRHDGLIRTSSIGSRISSIAMIRSSAYASVVFNKLGSLDLDSLFAPMPLSLLSGCKRSRSLSNSMAYLTSFYSLFSNILRDFTNAVWSTNPSIPSQRVYVWHTRHSIS